MYNLPSFMVADEEIIELADPSALFRQRTGRLVVR
jgi:hypothetical protein